MQQCSVHVAFQLPNEYTRVGYLLDAIETSDASLQAAMALVRNDTNSLTGKRSDFEATATCLLPHDPVKKNETLVEEMIDREEPKYPQSALPLLNLELDQHELICVITS